VTTPDVHAGIPTYDELDHALRLANEAETAAEGELRENAEDLHRSATRYAIAEARHARAVAARRDLEDRLGM
jgi:hypothetical protein